MIYPCPNCGRQWEKPFCPDCRIHIKTAANIGTPQGNEIQTGTAISREPGVLGSPASELPERASADADPWEQADQDWKHAPQEADDVDQGQATEAPPRPPHFSVLPPESRGAGTAWIDSSERSEFDSTGEILLEGQRAVEENLHSGYEIFLVAGITASGKTQLLEAFARLNPGYLRSHEMQGDGKQVKRTTVGTLEVHSVPLPGRTVAFLDAPGELFEKLLPSEGRIEKESLQLPKLIAKHLRGLVLVFDLLQFWSEDVIRPAAKRQIEILAWVLEILRWARHQGAYPVNTSIPLDRYITQETRTMKQRLDIPVLVLFSKADELRQQTIPEHGRKLRPEQEQPFFFARHCLPDLYGAVEAHADHFHFDFIHSIVSDPGNGPEVEPSAPIISAPPCGIQPAFDWLLDPAWERRGGVPSRRWISIQQWLDHFTGRRRRWLQLSQPKRMPR